MKAAVFFHYYENNSDYKENLVYFLSVAYREDADYFIIIADHCSIDLPRRENIRYITTQNRNNDYGGYVSAIKILGDTLNQYDILIFVNSSVRGPFGHHRHPMGWIGAFTKPMAEDVHLVGSSINILSNESTLSIDFSEQYPGYPLPHSHVQTTAYALTKVAFEHLLNIGLYDCDAALPKDDVVIRYELRISQEIKKAGWNMKALLPRYNSIDYRLPHGDINPSSRSGDPLYRGAYFGKTARPRDLLFIKTNRNIISPARMAAYSLIDLLMLSSKSMLPWGERRRMMWRLTQRLLSSPFIALKELVQRAFGYMKREFPSRTQ